MTKSYITRLANECTTSVQWMNRIVLLFNVVNLSSIFWEKKTLSTQRWPLQLRKNEQNSSGIRNTHPPGTHRLTPVTLRGLDNDDDNGDGSWYSQCCWDQFWQLSHNFKKNPCLPTPTGANDTPILLAHWRMIFPLDCSWAWRHFSFVSDEIMTLTFFSPIQIFCPISRQTVMADDGQVSKR